MCKLDIRRFLPAHLGGHKRNIYNEFVKWHLGRRKIIHDWIRDHRCRKIMEIGIDDAENAKKMIQAAGDVFPIAGIRYYGFDLFDKPLPEDEVGGSSVDFTENHVREKLEQTGAQIVLVGGDTRRTLPETVDELPEMDLIYIDGGHSYKTVKNDWNYSKTLMKKESGVFFDDYAIHSGVRRVVDEISNEYSVKIVGPFDNKMALVQRRRE